MKQITHSRKLRQLDRLVKSMKQAMRDQQPKEFVDKIGQKIAILVHQLRGILSKQQLVKRLGALAILFGLTTTSYAQNFVAPITDPFGFTPDANGYIGGICVADFDDDGDLDIMIGGYYGTIIYYENTGTAANPTYGTGISDPFGLTAPYYYSFLTAADLDDDGDIDLLAGEYYGALQYFENTGTATSPAFAAAQTNPFGLSSAQLVAMPELVDIDDDGDYDLFVGQYLGILNYFENTGTATSPAFAAAQVNPFGLSSAYGFAYPSFADLDNDGDMDLLVSQYYGTYVYFENTGTVSSPAFAPSILNPFGLTQAGDIALSAMADIDDDGDQDLLASIPYGSLAFFENTEFNASLGELENNVGIAPNPFQDVLELQSDSKLESVEVYSITGQMVYSDINPSDKLLLSDLNPGIYLVKVVDANGKITQQKVEKL